MSPRAGLDNDSVIAAAVALADANGLESLSLTALASQLGIRTPSLYNHINGLDGLRQALALRGMRELADRLGHVAMGKAGDEAILALGYAYRAFVSEHPGLYAATVRSPRIGDSPDPAILKVEGRLLDVILAVLSAYQLTKIDALHAARALRSLVHGFATLESSGGFGIALDIDESFRYMVAVFIEGLRHHQRLP